MIIIIRHTTEVGKLNFVSVKLEFRRYGLSGAVGLMFNLCAWKLPVVAKTVYSRSKTFGFDLLFFYILLLLRKLSNTTHTLEAINKNVVPILDIFELTEYIIVHILVISHGEHDNFKTQCFCFSRKVFLKWHKSYCNKDQRRYSKLEPTLLDSDF